MRRPRFIAEQARNAKGPLGRLVAIVMAHETRAQNVRAIEALRVAENDHVLDIGCGPGRSLAELAARSPNGRVVGVDSSELMVEFATRRNQALVKAGRAEIAIARADALPFADAAFDKVLCVHVIYFWNDLPSGLREIARVLKPGGRLALLFRSPLDRMAVRSFPAEVYRFRDVADVQAALLAEGFALEAAMEPDIVQSDRSASPHLLLAFRRVP